MSGTADRRKVLVIGGGIAGITASLDLADAGHEVALVERLPSIGGRMLQLSETFPTLDCAQCTLTPRTAEAGQHPNIELVTYSEVIGLDGQAGNFTARVRRRARHVDWPACTGCGACQEKCPTWVTDPFERGVGRRKAIYTLTPQAVPNKPVIDAANCRHLKGGKCGVCAQVCSVGAIDYEQKDSIFEENVAAVVVATGFDLYPIDAMGEYGYGTIPDVIDNLAMERLLSPSGPTAGKVLRPSDGKEPKHVVLIHCVGSRDPENHKSYCSRICCMSSVKHARLYRHRVPDGKATLFYMDLRATGKGYEEFLQQATEEEGIVYVRGRVSKVFREGDRIALWGADTLTGEPVRTEADMVVLAMALVPNSGQEELARVLGIPVDENGFLRELDYKVASNDTVREGIFVAGCAQGPRDITDAVAHASAAASRVQVFLSRLGRGVRV